MQILVIMHAVACKAEHIVTLCVCTYCFLVDMPPCIVLYGKQQFKRERTHRILLYKHECTPYIATQTTQELCVILKHA